MIRAGSPVNIQVSGAVASAYSWNTGETTQTISVQPSVTTTYIVKITDTNGCDVWDTISITIDDACDDNADVFVPNSFSPNDDGQNDKLQLYEMGAAEMIYFAVYNRWGEKVFESSEITQTWDGTQRGKPCNTAVYGWLLKITCKTDSNERIKKGNVSLLR